MYSSPHRLGIVLQVSVLHNSHNTLKSLFTSSSNHGSRLYERKVTFALMGEALINNPPATNHKELELVITCISLDLLKEKRIDQILDNTLDWSKFIQIANEQGVLPICCQQIIKLSDDRIPAGHYRQLQRNHHGQS